MTRNYIERSRSPAAFFERRINPIAICCQNRDAVLEPLTALFDLYAYVFDVGRISQFIAVGICRERASGAGN